LTFNRNEASSRHADCFLGDMISMNKAFLPLLAFVVVQLLTGCGPSREAVASRSFWDNMGRSKKTLKDQLQAIPNHEFPMTNGVIDLTKCTPDDFKAMSDSDQATQKAWLDYADKLKGLPRELVDVALVNYATSAEDYARQQVTSYGMQDKLHQFIMTDRQTFGGKKVTKENVAQINANIVEINRLAQEAATFAAKVDAERPKVDTMMNATKDAMVAKYSTFKQ
jgi:hypothetical protein